MPPSAQTPTTTGSGHLSEVNTPHTYNYVFDYRERRFLDVRRLSAECHGASNVIAFDVNGATLQVASDPVLQEILALLKKDASIKVAVLGHTDTLGPDDYNQRLSELRASAVVAWLTQHSIAGDRLTAKGYGKTRPAADNGNVAGRSKNRRVEIDDPNCTPGGK